MKLKISRSFSKRVQLKQFEPIESTCTVEAELEAEHINTAKISEELDQVCRQEVEKTLNKFKAIDTWKAQDQAKENAQLEAPYLEEIEIITPRTKTKFNLKNG